MADRAGHSVDWAMMIANLGRWSRVRAGVSRRALTFLSLALLALPRAANAAGWAVDGISPVWWGGISGGITISLLVVAGILLINRRRSRRERDLFASSLDTLPIARQIVSP